MADELGQDEGQAPTPDPAPPPAADDVPYPEPQMEPIGKDYKPPTVDQRDD